jgi:hypothetical protein
MSHLSPAEQILALDTPDQHGTFIRTQWPSFAAFAWEKYLSEGRGAIVVDLRHATLEGTAINVPTLYVAEGSDKLVQRGGWPSEEVAEVIRSYDPAQDVIFIFLRLDGDVFHYNASDELTPPQAHDASRTKRPSIKRSK